MRRARLALAVLGLPASLAAQQPEFPSAVDVVRVDAVVLDRDGRPVEGLCASDFELLEDGRPKAITSFEAVVVSGRKPEPVEVPKPARPRPADGALFGLFYDDLHLTPASTAPARDAVRRLLLEAARPGDRVTIVAPDQDVWWSARLDEGRSELLAIADRLQGRRTRGSSASDYQALLVHQRGEEGLLDRYTPEAVKARATSEAQQEQEAAELRRQIAAGGGRIDTPPSTIGGLRHPDLRGLDSPTRVADAAGDYADALRLNRAALGALRDVVAAFELVPGRKSLVVVSEGIIDDPEIGELAQVVAAARRANTVLYFLDLRGLEGSGYLANQPSTGPPAPPSTTVATLLRQGAGIGTERLAEETGGRTLASNDLADGLGRVAAEAHAYYLLGYEPAGRGRPGERKLTVRVTKPGLTVRTRPAWRAEARVPSPSALASATPAPVKPTTPAAPAPASSDRPRDALDLLARSGADLAEVPLALSAYVFDETAPGRARVVVAADLDLPPAKAGTAVAFRMLVVPLAEGRGLRHDGTETLEPSPQPPWTGGFGTHAPLARTFDLAPGRYQARLAVEVVGRARRGAATLTFDVPPLDGLRLSSPIVTDRLGERLDRAPRPVVHGLEAFWPNATLYCQFEVYGAAPGPAGSPAVEAGYTLRAPDGTVVKNTSPTRIQATAEGRVLRLFGFPLSGLAPGVYSLDVHVRDTASGAAARAEREFRVREVRR
jgi:VWFA-related protein